MSEKNIYYDNSRILSYKEFYKITVGTRGRGKTTKWILTALKKFLKDESQFIYVRRYKTEHRNIKKFWDNLIKINQDNIKNNKKPIFPPNTELEVIGNWKEGLGQFKVNNKIAGYWLTLSIASSYKSTPFPNVNGMIFDEFLIKKGTYHYLQDEVNDLEDLVETVFRTRDDPNVWGCVLLANNVSWFNPYFIQWKIPVFNTKYYRPPNDSIVIELDTDSAFNEVKYSTRFGQHIRNTKYGNYAVENESLISATPFIEELSKNAKLYFNIRYLGSIYGIWIDTKENKLYLSNKYDPYCKLEYALTTSDHQLNTFYIKNKKSTHLSLISEFYQMGRMFATSNYLDSVLQEILQILL